MSDKKKFKIMTISDHILVASGVALQTRYLVEGLLATGNYEFRCLGGAIKHPDYRPHKTEEWGDDVIIYPVDGYGNEQIIRQLLDIEKPDAVFAVTDPRFYIWLFNMSDEIRDRGIPILYWTIWDNFPTPVFNLPYYNSCDFLGCISQLTFKIMKNLGLEDKAGYIPHAVDSDIFTQFPKESIIEKRKDILKLPKDKFILFYNSRNARRKMTSDVLRLFKAFMDKHDLNEKCFLFMHTDPHDREGANLFEVAKMLGIRNDQIAFSSQRIPPQRMAEFYNICDCTINISNNEGFGLSILESLSCGTLVTTLKTGGLQDQPIDDEGNEFGVMITNVQEYLTGSQEIPFILDSRVLDGDVVDALKKIYDMPRADRYKLGTKARQWTLKAFSMQNMIDSWDQAFRKHIELYKDGNPDRIRFKKV